jgi:hypothetical protein
MFAPLAARSRGLDLAVMTSTVSVLVAFPISSNPITISTIDQLDAIGTDPLLPLSGNYNVAKDIDATGFSK